MWNNMNFEIRIIQRRFIDQKRIVCNRFLIIRRRISFFFEIQDLNSGK